MFSLALSAWDYKGRAKQEKGNSGRQKKSKNFKKIVPPAAYA
jgi:hypothetical protein